MTKNGTLLPKPPNPKAVWIPPCHFRLGFISARPAATVAWEMSLHPLEILFGNEDMTAPFWSGVGPVGDWKFRNSHSLQFQIYMSPSQIEIFMFHPCPVL